MRGRVAWPRPSATTGGPHVGCVGLASAPLSTWSLGVLRWVPPGRPFAPREPRRPCWLRSAPPPLRLP
eukprot:4092409-Alexandrium_andersonii.AAC.1